MNACGTRIGAASQFGGPFPHIYIRPDIRPDIWRPVSTFPRHFAALQCIAYLPPVVDDEQLWLDAAQVQACQALLEAAGRHAGVEGVPGEAGGRGV